MRELKRWNPIKGTDGKTDRPMCEAMQNGTRCLQHCRNLIVEPNGMHGCLELDFKEKMVRLADHIMSIGKPPLAPSSETVSDLPPSTGKPASLSPTGKRGPGRPKKGE